DRLSERGRLRKGQANAFPRERIDRARSVADQRESAVTHTSESAQRGANAAHSIYRAQIAQPGSKRGHLAKGLAESQTGAARGDRDAQFLGSNRGDNNLAIARPVDFNEIGPGSRTELLPGGKTDLLASGQLEACTLAEWRSFT